MLLAPLAFLSAAIAAPPPVKPGTALRGDTVVVIGALHELHAQEPDFDHATLRRAILAFRPDILVLEVRPDELADRTDTPGRPEYPAVVWPLLNDFAGHTVAMEPDGITFEQLSSAAGDAFAKFRRANPAGSSLLSRLQRAVDGVLLEHWTSPALSQDKTTGAVVKALQDTRSDLVGPAFVKVQASWDGYMAERAREAVAANPGKRVLVLASFRNRGLIEEGIRDAASARLMDAGAWFSLIGNAAFPSPAASQR